MKRLILLLLLAVSLTAQTLDKYGGRTDVLGVNTGFWHIQKINNRWWFIDPLGNGFYDQSIGAWIAPPNPSKYSSNSCTVAADIISEAQGWGFNGVGQLSNYTNIKLGNSCPSNPQLPQSDTTNVSLYSTVNGFITGNGNFTITTRPTKNVITGNNDFSLCSGTNSSTCRNTGGVANFRGGGSVDVFDPIYAAFMNGEATNDFFIPGGTANPFHIITHIDDTDFLPGFGGTPDFETAPVGHNKPNVAYIILTTSPALTYSANTYNATPVYYSDFKVYTKVLMASPPGTCSKATPCSLGTYLQKLYSSNITNLNNAWVTGGFYTTFGSSGCLVGYTDALDYSCGSGSSSETICASPCSAGVITHTLANTQPSQFSIQLLFNGVDFGGDCPGISVYPSCQVAALPNNGGTFPTVVFPPTWTSGSKIVGQQILDSNGYVETYTTAGASGGSAPSWSSGYHVNTTDGTAVARNDGPILLTGPLPFLQNDPCTGLGSGFGAASFWAQITYHGTPPIGLSTQIPSRLVGNSCAAGQTVIVSGPDGATGSKANPTWATGYDVYASCRNASGGALNGCAASGPNTAPPLTLQASNIPLSQITLITCNTGTVTINVVGSVPSGFQVGDSVNLFRTTGGFDLGYTTPGILTAVTPTALAYNQPGGTCPSPSGSGGTIWKEYVIPNAPLLSGAALPSPPSTIDYVNHVINLTFSANLQTGITITANYINCGFGCGTGLLDEDGRNTTWVGFESVCLKPVAGGGPGTTSYACRLGNAGGYAQPTMHTQVATDLSAWQTQYASQYAQTITNAVAQGANPKMLKGGPDTIGDWYLPPRNEILAGFAGNVDAIFVTWNHDVPDVTTAALIRSYLETAYGDHPIMNFQTLEANPDSAFSGSNPAVFGFATQPLRGAAWLNTQNAQINTLGANNSFQWIGINWWGNSDCSVNEGTNWGMKTCTDNSYDAHEASAGVVSCSIPISFITCGSEPPTTSPGTAVRPYGNALAQVTTANALWLNLPGSGVPPPSAVCIVCIGGKD